jgi:hypothetical protein
VAAGAVLTAAFAVHALRRGSAALVDLTLFRDGFWWALGISAAAVVPIALLPRRRSAASVVEGDGSVAEPVDDRV